MGRHLTRDDVRRIDRDAVELHGIPTLLLMENAGRGVADVLWHEGCIGPVIIACGKGNNGGDGLVLARHLAVRNVPLQIHLFADPATLSPDAAANWNIVQKMHLPARVWNEFTDDEIATAWRGAEWIVDALFGIGLAGPLRPPFDRLVNFINGSGAKVLAIDLPSGLDCDTGEPLGPTIRATATVTMVAPKIGFRNPAAVPFLGRVHVADIGAPWSAS